MVKIISDTTSCIPLEEAARLGIGYLPQIIVFGEETYRDDTEMNAIAFLKRLKASQTLPKTAAPPPALYHPLFRQYAAEGQPVVVICPSSDVSGTYRSATVALQELADELPGADIRVVDTRRVAGGMGAIVKCAVQWANDGLSATEIVTRSSRRCQSANGFISW